MIGRIKEIFRWRQLLFSLTSKELKSKYRQASGGFGWMLVMPLVQTVIFSFIFRYIFKVKIGHYTLFLLSGLFSWAFFRSSLDGAANSILGNASLIKKTYFPREILPISSVMANLVSFFFALVVLLAFSLLSGVSWSRGLVWLPWVIFIQVVLTLGIALFLAGMNTVYREVQFIMDILLLVWFYATPIVYSLEMVKNTLPKSMFFFYQLNPMAGIIRSYQNIFFLGLAPEGVMLFGSSLAAGTLFALGFLNFRRYEKVFEDMV